MIVLLTSVYEITSSGKYNKNTYDFLIEWNGKSGFIWLTIFNNT